MPLVRPKARSHLKERNNLGIAHLLKPNLIKFCKIKSNWIKLWKIKSNWIKPHQDSLHTAQLLAQERAAAAAAAAKKKGLKSSLGRIFGKKDKGLKSRSGGFVTAPLSAQPHFGETEMVQVDNFPLLNSHFHFHMFTFTLSLSYFCYHTFTQP